MPSHRRSPPKTSWNAAVRAAASGCFQWGCCRRPPSARSADSPRPAMAPPSLPLKCDTPRYACDPPGRTPTLCKVGSRTALFWLARWRAGAAAEAWRQPPRSPMAWEPHCILFCNEPMRSSRAGIGRHGYAAGRPWGHGGAQRSPAEPAWTLLPQFYSLPTRCRCMRLDKTRSPRQGCSWSARRWEGRQRAAHAHMVVPTLPARPHSAMTAPAHCDADCQTSYL